MNQIHQELRAVGMARRNHTRTAAEIEHRVQDVLRRSRGAVSVSEAARLLGVDRSTVYRMLARA